MTSEAFDPSTETGWAPGGSDDVKATRRSLRPNRHLVLALLGLLAVGGITWYGWNWWQVGRFIEATDDAYVGGNITTLSPHVAGFVSKILVNDNQFVKAGQLLIQLDDRDYQANLAHAEAVVQHQMAALANLHAKYDLQNSMIGEAQAKLAANEAEAGYARIDAARYHTLALTSYGSLQSDQKAFAADRKAEAIVRSAEAELDAKYVLQQAMVRQAEADLNVKLAQATFARQDAVRYRDLAKTTFGTVQNAQRTSALDVSAGSATEAAQAGLAAARQQLSVLDAEIAGARAGVAQAEADLETARLNIGYTEIRSPIDGYIGNRSAQVGAYVARDAYLVSVIPTRGLWVDANFKEDQLAQMRAGQPAEVVADVVPNKVFHGHVLSLAPGTGAVFSVIPPENATGNFTKIVQRVPVRISLDDARLGELRPGLSTTVSVDTKRTAQSEE